MLAALPAAATVGGDSTHEGFCLERGGRRILYLHALSGESGCDDTVRAIELASGRDTELVSCSTGGVEREKLFAGCTRLEPAALEDLGVKAGIHRAESPKAEPVRPGNPLDVDRFSIQSPQELTLRRGSRRLGPWVFGVCHTPYREHVPPVVSMTAYTLPGKPFLLTRLRYSGICFESGYTKDTSLLVPDAFGAQGAPSLQGQTPRHPRTWALLDLPAQDWPRLYNDTGFSLYQQGHLEQAVGFFQRAYELSRPGNKPHLLALYNQAATLSRLGRREEVLATLRILFSYAAERERFRKKVATDEDFASMREEPKLTALLTEAECCREESVHVQSDGSRVEVVVRWAEGERTELRNTVWRRGVKVQEWDTLQGVGRSWHENGQLMTEGPSRAVGEWNGVVRTWRPDGTLESETEYFKFWKHGLERKYDEKGRLTSIQRWKDDVLAGSEPVPSAAPPDAGAPPVP